MTRLTTMNDTGIKKIDRIINEISTPDEIFMALVDEMSVEHILAIPACRRALYMELEPAILKGMEDQNRV